MGSLLRGGRAPSPPSFPSDGLQTPQRNKEAGWSCHFPHIFSTTRAECWSSHVPLPLPLGSFSYVSHLFLRVVLWEKSIKSKAPGEAQVCVCFVRLNMWNVASWTRAAWPSNSTRCVCNCLSFIRSLFLKDPPGGFSSQEKTVSLKKEPRLSLGITIAGGRDCRSRLPVYITSVQPVGCLYRDGTIKRGTKQHLVMCESFILCSLSLWCYYMCPGLHLSIFFSVFNNLTFNNKIGGNVCDILPFVVILLCIFTKIFTLLITFEKLESAHLWYFFI